MQDHRARLKGLSAKYRSTRRGMVVILVASRVCLLPLAHTVSVCGRLLYKQHKDVAACALAC